MKILFVSPQIPWPLLDGGKKAIYYPLKYLAAKGHTIHLACLSETRDEEALDHLRAFCGVTAVIHSKKRTPMGFLSSWWDQTPYLLSRFHTPQMLSELLAVLKDDYDVVHIEGLHCAYYGLEIMRRHRIPIALRLHNVESMIVSRYASQARNPLVKWYAQLECSKLEAYEDRVLKQFGKVMLISGEDQRVITSRSNGARTTVLTAGVDTEFFSPATDTAEPDTILWMGAFQWPPNRNSFWWFVRSILPRIVDLVPAVKVLVVGSHPQADIQSFDHPNVKVIGQVEDVREFINRSAVCVVPLQVGGGIRLKLLELFAMKKAIVSTSVGCEGLDVRDNEHLLVADTEEDFARAVIRLLQDEAMRMRLGEEGRRYVIGRHSWSAIAAEYETVYRGLQTANES